MNHTNESWTVKQGPHGEFTDVYSSESPECLATTAMLGWSRAEREEHAALIAALPELLDAVEAALDYIVNGIGMETDEEGEVIPEVIKLCVARDKAKRRRNNVGL